MKKELLMEINKIFADVFDNDNLKIYEKTTSKEIPEWDSLAHIQLIVAIEKHFKIRFQSGEVDDFENVGAMLRAISEKIENETGR